MNKRLIIGMFITILLLISGCANKELDSLNEDNERLTKDNLHLKNLVFDLKAELSGLKDSLNMVRFSSGVRLNDDNDSFDNLKNIYKITSNYVIKDDWYMINDDYFQMELSGYENAHKVDFYKLRMESAEGSVLVFTDTEPSDGWIYSSEAISKIIDKHKKLKFGRSYEPYFIMYTEVTLEDGNVIKTSKLPIYNK